MLSCRDWRLERGWVAGLESKVDKVMGKLNAGWNGLREEYDGI